MVLILKEAINIASMASMVNIAMADTDIIDTEIIATTAPVIQVIGNICQELFF
jgi:hypothetical protein